MSNRYMRQLKVYRVQHWLNDSGQEVDIGGTPVRQKVNLGRLILLIKPVSLLNNYFLRAQDSNLSIIKKN